MISQRRQFQVFAWPTRHVRLAAMALVLLTALVFAALPANAQSGANIPAKLRALDMQQYGRLILDFPGRLDLPTYKVQAENNVLTLEFEQGLAVELPDVSGSLERYVTIARLDPDRRGIRMGLKGDFRINTMEAGEKLFIDILPPGWTGLMPGLPTDVVQELSRRAREAAIDAERKRKAELVASGEPEVTLRIGKHPTFVRYQFEWSLDTSAKYSFEAPVSRLQFALPLEVDLSQALAQLPDEVLELRNRINVDGSEIVLTAGEGVVPRYYANSKREFIIDIDLKGADPTAVDLESLLPETTTVSDTVMVDPSAPPDDTDMAAKPEIDVVSPTVETVGETVRVAFPFAAETAAAVFRRGDVLWMLFDTETRITAPEAGTALDDIAEKFDVLATGGTQIVRVTLSTERLATLASEGRSWVLSLGDIILAAAEPMAFSRVQDDSGAFSVHANLSNAARVHEVRDPEVGDLLQVVTAYPPSRATLRSFDFVDFSALKTVQGLVIKPNNDDVVVDVNDDFATISASRGLIVSAPQGARARDAQQEARIRDGFIDLNPYVEADPRKFVERLEQMKQRAADAERRLLDAARLELARFYLANRLTYEAVGMTQFMRTDLANKDLTNEVRLLQAAANASSGRAGMALSELNSESMAGRVDALMWRTIARADALDFPGARVDALAAEDVVEAYPLWVQTAFYMAGIRSALETGDAEFASRLLGKVDTASLDTEQITRYELYAGRLDEAERRFDEALDTYGKVIAADIRPTRAEAILLTLKLLDRMGRLDPTRAADTLANETVMWRGDELEADMLTLQADLFFRSNNFRGAFETVHSAALAHPYNQHVVDLVDSARQIFADLYLNGQADSLSPVEALTLYYDYREFTPAGARGDEMVRNLARRLVRVDLLAQAAELLEYQVTSRLQGAAKAQIAADLAIISIADRRPQKALEALNLSRVSGLSPALERQRRVIEARALIDAGREDLALDLLASMDGRDADLLRVDAHWRSKRYRDAAELIERLYSSLQPDEALSPSVRSNLIRAAVGFVLADDRIGMTRLRSKFSDRLVQTPEWALFDFVTGEVEVTSVAFRKIAQEVADMDSLNAFLRSYRDLYEPDGSLVPSRASAAADA